MRTFKNSSIDERCGGCGQRGETFVVGLFQNLRVIVVNPEFGIKLRPKTNSRRQRWRHY